MRQLSWALIGMTALMAVGVPSAEAGSTCKWVPQWCPADAGNNNKGTKSATPVPEPAAFLLLGAGVTAIGAAALRRRKNNKDR
jgi:hypothetical protein